jgi:hypothetical protein
MPQTQIHSNSMNTKPNGQAGQLHLQLALSIVALLDIKIMLLS